MEENKSAWKLCRVGTQRRMGEMVGSLIMKIAIDFGFGSHLMFENKIRPPEGWNLRCLKYRNKYQPLNLLDADSTGKITVISTSILRTNRRQIITNSLPCYWFMNYCIPLTNEKIHDEPCKLNYSIIELNNLILHKRPVDFSLLLMQNRRRFNALKPLTLF